MLSSPSYNATMGPSAGLTMRRHYLPFRPNAALVVLLPIFAAFAWAGSDETRLERQQLGATWAQQGGQADG